MKTLLALILLFTTFMTLSALSFQQSHHFSQKNIAHMASSQNLTLRLDAAARGGYPLGDSYLQIHWNDVLVSKWQTTDYQIYHLQFNVTAKNGFNNLSFSYPQASGGGSCFTNVSLKGQDNQELVVNGFFTSDQVQGRNQLSQFNPSHPLNGWGTFDGFEVAVPGASNINFTTNSASVNSRYLSVYQTFNLKFVQQGYILLDPLQKLTLSLDVAARDKPYSIALNASWLHVFWNGVLIQDWRTTDYNIYHLTFKVKPIDGLNTLLFSTPSSMEGGCVFNNVSLTRAQDQKELVVNGHFENLVFKNGVWNDYNVRDTIVGWRTFNAFAVGSKTFNNRFTSNLVTLDNNHPTLYQTFKFKIDDPSAN